MHSTWLGFPASESIQVSYVIESTWIPSVPFGNLTGIVLGPALEKQKHSTSKIKEILFWEIKEMHFEQKGTSCLSGLQENENPTLDRGKKWEIQESKTVIVLTSISWVLPYVQDEFHLIFYSLFVKAFFFLVMKKFTLIKQHREQKDF